MYLIGASDLVALKSRWEDYLREPDGTSPEHPNAFITFRMCAVFVQSEDACEVDISINNSTRYHAAFRTLPRNAFVACLSVPAYHGRSYLVVDQGWFDDIVRMPMSLYAMVDAAGMKDLLRRGGLRDAMVSDLEGRISAIATDSQDCAFVTFADTVLIKMNWTAGDAEYRASYQPERFLQVVARVSQATVECLGLPAYSIVTQGANQVTNDPLLRVNPSNHVFFGSLGAPFAELYEIDKAARAAIRAGKHAPETLYLSHAFALTLDFSSDSARERSLARKYWFTSSGVVERFSFYHPLNHVEVLETLVTPTS